MTCDESQLAPSRLAGIVKTGFARLAIIVVLLASLGALFPDPAVGQEPVPVPLTVEVVKDLNFGEVASLGFPGTVLIPAVPGGRKRVTGGAVNLGGDHGAAEVKIKGEGDAPFRITLLPKLFSIPRTAGGASVDITLFTALDDFNGVLNAGGNATVFIGGTLTLPPGQLGGTYRGLFDIFVDPRD